MTEREFKFSGVCDMCRKTVQILVMLKDKPKGWSWTLLHGSIGEDCRGSIELRHVEDEP